MAKSILIGDRHYRTKKAAGDACRAVLYRYSPGQTVGGDDVDFLWDLLQMHPEASAKIGVGVASFQVEQNEGSMGFWLTRVDGSRTDFSFVKTLTPPTAKQEALAGLRVAIRWQIERFRRGNLLAGAVCAVTGETLDGNAHVDHEPPFETLVERFRAVHQLTWEQIEVEPTTDGSTDTKIVSKDLEKAWSDFHEQHAGLRLVTRQANLSLLKKRPSAEGALQARGGQAAERPDLKTCMIFGDLSSDSTDEQYPHVTICEDCIAQDEKREEEAVIVQIVGDYDPVFGEECQFCE